MNKKLTCIICPIGCELIAILDEKEVISVSGNTCPRGEIYARNECINPQRTITSTMLCEDGSLVSVKTDTTIPKEKMQECMQIINSNTAKLPIAVGDVLIENVFGSNIVATQNRSK